VNRPSRYSWQGFKLEAREIFYTIRNIPCTARLRPVATSIVLIILPLVFTGSYFLHRTYYPTVDASTGVLASCGLCSMSLLLWFLGQSLQHQDRWKHKMEVPDPPR